MKEAGPEDDDDQGRRHHPVREPPAEHGPEREEPQGGVDGCPGSYRIQLRARVPVGVEPLGQREEMAGQEEGDEQGRLAHGVLVEPVADGLQGQPVGGRTEGRVLRVVEEVVEKDAPEAGVAIDEVGREVGVVPLAIRAHRWLVGEPEVIDEPVTEQAEHEGGHDHEL